MSVEHDQQRPSMVDEQIFAAAKNGDTTALAALLDAHPEKLHLRDEPYEHTLLHLAAAGGHVDTVKLRLDRGLDVNVREQGDNTYAMHWAAAEGHLDVVRTLADAGGDVVGHGDDHALDVIGWATCFHHCHRQVAELLVERGAHHHIFSAIAMELPDEVRRIASIDRAAVNTRMSRNEEHQLPLHFAVRSDRHGMVTLLLELGADPLAADGAGFSAAAYALSPEVDRPVMEAIASQTAAELLSASRGHRPARVGVLDLLAALALRNWDTAERMVRDEPRTVRPAATASALHMASKRGDVAAVKWLLDRGADPNALWDHWDAELTPLHLAALAGHLDVARALLEAGADPGIRDSKHEGDAIGWAQFFQRPEIARLLRQP
jgi:ankyrin repeat protein